MFMISTTKVVSFSASSRNSMEGFDHKGAGKGDLLLGNLLAFGIFITVVLWSEIITARGARRRRYKRVEGSLHP